MSDERLIETLRRDFQPEPMSPARAAAFRRELESRLEGRPRWRLALPAFALAAAAALALWLALPGAQPNESTVTTSAELDAFVDPETLASEITEPASYLPSDYQELALLLDGDSADP
jgi:hypothetical protein